MFWVEQQRRRSSYVIRNIDTKVTRCVRQQRFRPLHQHGEVDDLEDFSPATCKTDPSLIKFRSERQLIDDELSTLMKSVPPAPRAEIRKVQEPVSATLSVPMTVPMTAPQLRLAPAGASNIEVEPDCLRPHNPGQRDRRDQDVVPENEGTSRESSLFAQKPNYRSKRLAALQVSLDRITKFKPIKSKTITLGINQAQLNQNAKTLSKVPVLDENTNKQRCKNKCRHTVEIYGNYVEQNNIVLAIDYQFFWSKRH